MAASESISAQDDGAIASDHPNSYIRSECHDHKNDCSSGFCVTCGSTPRPARRRRRTPARPGQLELGRLLLRRVLADWADRRRANAESASCWPRCPPTVRSRTCPSSRFNAHVDTSPETTGAGVNRKSCAITAAATFRLPGDAEQVIRVAENPELHELLGSTIITTDGTTLLGADDKAGVAVIMETAAYLRRASRRSSTVRCGSVSPATRRSATAWTTSTWSNWAPTVCYTLDGQGANEIDVETFSADLAVVTVRGVNIHPSIAKGRMVNAVRVAADFIARLPRDELAPEATERPRGLSAPLPDRRRRGRSADCGFCCATSTRRGSTELADAAARPTAAEACHAFPGATIDVEITPQYRNMAEGLAARAAGRGYAQRALERLGTHAREADDRPRRHRRLATDRAGLADAQPLDRRAQSPLAAGMDLPGGDGARRSKCSSNWSRSGLVRRRTNASIAGIHALSLAQAKLVSLRKVSGRWLAALFHLRRFNELRPRFWPT